MKSSVELFTGCGGLAMGLSRAGFRSQGMVEWDRHSVANVLHNRARGLEHVADWPIHLEDVRAVDWTQYSGVDLVAGGPPCQPFSIGGKHRGDEDRRDMWPEAIRAVREIAPRAFFFENVRGLARSAFAEYLRWVTTALAHPDVARLDGETRREHLGRLARAGAGLYRVRVTQTNAADYGAAQKRHRVVILGLRRDAGEGPPAIPATHSRDRLLWDQWVTGDYWRRHGERPPDEGPNRADTALVERLRTSPAPRQRSPGERFAMRFQGLGEPGAGRVSNHGAQPGARSYPGHTGSGLDGPAKALKAGVHGVPGGENTIALANGQVRYLTVREAARLQGMPDGYEFVGSWSENMRQLGNAVPTPLAEAVARALRAFDGRSSAARRQHKAA